MQNFRLILVSMFLAFIPAAFANPVQLEIYYNPGMNKGLTGFSGSWCSVADRPGLLMEGKAHLQLIPVGREAFDALKSLDPAVKHQCEVEGTVGPGDEFLGFYVAHVRCR